MILGVVLLDNRTFEQAAHALDPEMFFSPSHRKIFTAMSRMYQTGKVIDPLTLQNELERTGDLEQIGGPAFIASLFDGCPRFSNIESYVRIVREKFQARQLVATGSLLLNRAMDDDIEVDEQLRMAERALLDITNRDASAHWTHIGAAANSYLAGVEDRHSNPRPVVGLSTGFNDLDYMTLGLERGTVNIVAARPGVGKTGFALSLTENISESPWNRQDGQPPVIAWFSFEMHKDQLARRLLASRAQVNMRKLHLGDLTKDEFRRVMEAEQWLAGWRTHIDDRCGLNIPKMREAVRQLRRDEGDVAAIVIDYLQLGDGNEGGLKLNRAEEVGRFSRGITQLAKDYNVCVIALSQVNRLAESRGGNDRGRVGLGDLRESGQIEQDAYMVWGLYREAVYKSDSLKPNSLEVDILKQRNGPCPATVELYFDPSQMRFRDAYREEDAR